MLRALTALCLFGLFSSLTAAEELKEPAMRPLLLGEIKATGWLKNQLRIQADGLSGHLDTFWPDIQQSGWFGGRHEGWERAPYWLDGIIPLAYTLDDPNLMAKVKKYIALILQKQHDDGWLGPKTKNLGNFDLWSHFLVLKMLSQYQRATGDEKIRDAMLKGLRRIAEHIDKHPLRSWAKSRWFETLIPIFDLYEQTHERWLLDLAQTLRKQGIDWIGFFKNTPITEPTPRKKWNHLGHVVNNGMAVKSGGLCWRLTGSKADRMAAYDMIGKLDRYHGMATGMFTGDECLAGKDPTQGTELCSVVEFMYSLEMLVSVLGDSLFGDRLEKVCFNALPATFSPDMWSHQYDQQVNQVECSIKPRNWTTNGNESNIYGLEPNYGCCTSNLSQGWPKFAAHLWMRKEDGLAAVAYAPCSVKTSLNGTDVSINVDTNYPFREVITCTVSVSKPSRFPLFFRIPAWCRNASLEINGKTMKPEAGTFHKVEQKWTVKTTLKLTLPARPEIVRGYNNAVSIVRGPLLFALKIGEKWVPVNQNKKYREPPHGDWEVYPTTAWNYALDASEKTLENDITFSEKPLTGTVFSPADAPLAAKVKAVRLPEWKMVDNSAGPTPESPVTIDGKREEITLIPYGCTNLRIGEFPELK